MRGSDARVVKLVTTNSDKHAIESLFMRTEGGVEAAIGEFASAWNRRWSYKVNGVGADGHAGARILGESAKVVGVGENLDGLVWTAAEVVVFDSLAGLSVNDEVGLGAVGAGAERIIRGSQMVRVGRNGVHVGPEWIVSVQRWVSRIGDEMWWSHPQS